EERPDGRRVDEAHGSQVDPHQPTTLPTQTFHFLGDVAARRDIDLAREHEVDGARTNAHEMTASDTLDAAATQLVRWGTIAAFGRGITQHGGSFQATTGWCINRTGSLAPRRGRVNCRRRRLKCRGDSERLVAANGRR